jgi:hypothetical protein
MAKRLVRAKDKIEAAYIYRVPNDAELPRPCACGGLGALFDLQRDG